MMMRAASVVSGAAGWWMALLILCGAAAAEVHPEALLSGTAFERELGQPVSVSRDKVGIRELLERLAAERHIAIVLDRRIDPGRSIQAHIPPSTLRSALAEIARQADAVVRIVGDTVVVGPEDNLGLLRTLCVLRGLELDALGDDAARRRFELARTFTIAWNDLDRPADVLERVAQDAGLELAGLEQVPHDLWAGGVVVHMTAVEALSWVLVQYGLTFEWMDGATGVRIVPLAGGVAVTRDHPIRGIPVAAALRRVEERFPQAAARAQGRVLTATGLIEEHEAIAALARGEDPDAPAETVQVGSLANRRFTLRVVRKPAATVLESLQDSAVDLRIDSDALKAAQIDIDQKVSLELKQATIEELMEAICRAIGATYKVEGEIVRVPAP